jgi:hypothetical protein
MARQSFELTRFAWATPDRLEVAGRFVGMARGSAGEPVLVLHGADATHRLPAVVDASPPPGASDEGSWHAQFAWEEPPSAFELAELEFGQDLVVTLPEPDLDEGEHEPSMIEVVRRDRREQLHVAARVLVLESQLDEADARQARLEAELARARSDVEGERAARADAAEQYRAGIERLRLAADEAVHEARAEADALRARVGQLEPAAAELDALQARLASVRDLLDESVWQVERGGAAAP